MNINIVEKKKPIRFRVRTQFFILLITAVLTCALLVSSIASVLFTREIEEKARVSGNELLDATTARLAKYMQDLDDMAYPLMFNKTVQNVLSSLGRSGTSTYLRYTEQNNLSYALQLQAGINQDIEIAVFPKEYDGRYYTSQTDFLSSYDVRTEDWYHLFEEDATLNKLYLPNRNIAYRMSGERESAHQIVYRINSVYTTRTVGIMCIYLRPSAIENMLKDISENINNMALIGENGEIIFCMEDGMSTRQLQNYYQENGTDSVFTMEGKGYMLLGSGVSGTPWHILCAYDLSASQREARNICLLIFLVAVLCCLLCLPVIWRFLVRLLRPVEQLTIGMEWVKMGRLDFQLESGRQDELGQALTNFNDMTRELSEAHQNLKAMAALQREIGIAALRQQINPHFLYNTLDMIIGMTTQGDQAAIIEVCKALGGIFRYNLNGDYMVRLEQELIQTRRYIQISQYRFRGRFDVTYSVDKELLNQAVPKLILQPIVENSVLHGFSSISRKASMLIAINQAGAGRFCITVKDTGAGMSAAALQTLRDSLSDTDGLVEGKRHIGIRNVYARLHLVYGGEMSMDIESQLSAGTQITIMLPIR